jgi:hypothetical protein
VLATGGAVVEGIEVRVGGVLVELGVVAVVVVTGAFPDKSSQTKIMD